MMYEKQLRMKQILSFHNRINDKKLIDHEWEKYNKFYQSINTEISKFAQQTHRQLICNFN
jgi:hypothetical protein